MVGVAHLARAARGFRVSSTGPKQLAAPSKGRWRYVLQWFDSWAEGPATDASETAIDWPRVIPFAAMHVACFAVIWVGWSPFAVAVAAALYVLRMFAITAFYHRYFSHRSFQTSRLTQFVFAFLGATSVQRGPLWWASHHRHHHRNSDQPSDVHSPIERGFFWSHVVWFLTRRNFSPRLELVRDFAKYPELRFLDRFDVFAPFVLALGLFVGGSLLEAFAPGLGTSGPQLLVWGFVISTVVLYHGTFTINSFAHRFGTRRFDTPDDSRNNALLALITLGEGWHNNHHHYPGAVRQGFYWWEYDPAWWTLWLMERVGLVWNLRAVPASALERRRIR